LKDDPVHLFFGQLTEEQLVDEIKDITPAFRFHLTLLANGSVWHKFAPFNMQL